MQKAAIEAAFCFHKTFICYKIFQACQSHYLKLAI